MLKKIASYVVILSITMTFLYAVENESYPEIETFMSDISLLKDGVQKLKDSKDEILRTTHYIHSKVNATKSSLNALWGEVIREIGGEVKFDTKKVKKVKKRIRELLDDKKFTSINKQISDLEKEIKNLKNKPYPRTRGKVSQVAEKLNNLQQKIYGYEGFRDKINKLQFGINICKNQVNSYYGALNLFKELKYAKRDLEGLQGRFIKSSGEIKEKTDELREKKTTIQRQEKKIDDFLANAEEQKKKNEQFNILVEENRKLKEDVLSSQRTISLLHGGINQKHARSSDEDAIDVEKLKKESNKSKFILIGALFIVSLGISALMMWKHEDKSKTHKKRKTFGKARKKSKKGSS